jgi:DeoR/GlpR family transcriptional regulator of sugar metabolism
MERREIIAERLAQGRPVSAAMLANEFAMSPDAIRRDLRMLVAEGRCRRVYGGALPLSPASAPIAIRVEEMLDRKQALAEAAVSLIRPGEFLFLDSGSTNLALARLLPGLDLTVATNSAAIAASLANRRDLLLLLTGGVVTPEVGGCIDATSILAVQQMNVDRCFLGVCSLSEEQGMSAFDAADALFKRTLIANSRSVVTMLITDKLGTRAPHRVAALDEIDTVVVEHDAPTHAEFEALERLDMSIVIASPPV